MPEIVLRRSDRSFFVLLTPLFAASLPSLIFVRRWRWRLWLHGMPAHHSVALHFPGQGIWEPALLGPGAFCLPMDCALGTPT